MITNIANPQIVFQNYAGLSLFTCPRIPGELVLTTKGCADMWKKARVRKPEPWESTHFCRGCPIGAEHAGCASQAKAERSPDVLEKMCTRCHRIGMRLIHKRLCVSCYNRNRETQKGRNGKGTPPRKLSHLYAMSLTVIDGDVTSSQVQGAASMIEVILSVVQARTRKVMLARHTGRHPIRQGMIFGGDRIVGWN